MPTLTPRSVSKTGASSLRRQEGPNGETIGRTCDYVIVSQSLQGTPGTWKWWKTYESRPHKAVTFLVERDKEFQELRELKMPEALPGFSGGKLLGRRKAEGGKEVKKSKGKCDGWSTR